MMEDLHITMNGLKKKQKKTLEKNLATEFILKKKNYYVGWQMKDLVVLKYLIAMKKTK